MDFALLPSSSGFQIPSWVVDFFSRGVVFDHCQKGWVPGPGLPVQRFLVMSMLPREPSVWLVATLVADFQSDLVLTFALFSQSSTCFPVLEMFVLFFKI